MSHESNIKQMEYYLTTTEFLIDFDKTTPLQKKLIRQVAEQKVEEYEIEQHGKKPDFLKLIPTYQQQILTGKINYKEYLASIRWQTIKEMFKDNNICVDCEKYVGYRQKQIHHLTYKNINTAEELNDLVVICKKCHKKRHDIK